MSLVYQFFLEHGVYRLPNDLISVTHRLHCMSDTVLQYSLVQ